MHLVEEQCAYDRQLNEGPNLVSLPQVVQTDGVAANEGSASPPRRVRRISAPPTSPPRRSPPRRHSSPKSPPRNRVSFEQGVVQESCESPEIEMYMSPPRIRTQYAPQEAPTPVVMQQEMVPLVIPASPIAQEIPQPEPMEESPLNVKRIKSPNEIPEDPMAEGEIEQMNDQEIEQVDIEMPQPEVQAGEHLEEQTEEEEVEEEAPAAPLPPRRIVKANRINPPQPPPENESPMFDARIDVSHHVTPQPDPFSVRLGICTFGNDPPPVALQQRASFGAQSGGSAFQSPSQFGSGFASGSRSSFGGPPSDYGSNPSVQPQNPFDASPSTFRQQESSEDQSSQQFAPQSANFRIGRLNTPAPPRRSRQSRRKS